MELKKLKQMIENNSLSDSILVFEGWDTFLSDQYTRRICSNRGLTPRYVSNLSDIMTEYEDLFSSPENELVILKCSTVDCSDKSILKKKDTIIIVDKIQDDITRSILSDCIVTAPKLQTKYLDEYIEVSAPNLKPAQRRWLLDACNSNPYRIQQELDKITLFGKTHQATLFDSFMLDGMFSDLATDTILSFIEAIMTKNRKSVLRILENIHNIDIEPLGVITLLYRNIKLMLDIQFNQNASAESLDIKPGYFYVLKKRCGYYSKEQFVDAFIMLTKMEYKLKQGEMAESNIIDYILVNML